MKNKQKKRKPLFDKEIVNGLFITKSPKKVRLNSVNYAFELPEKRRDKQISTKITRRGSKAFLSIRVDEKRSFQFVMDSRFRISSLKDLKEFHLFKDIYRLLDETYLLLNANTLKDLISIQNR